MTKFLFVSVVCTVIAITFSSNLYFHDHDGKEQEDNIVKRFFSPFGNLFNLLAPPPEGQKVTLGVLVQVTCNDVSIDIVDELGVYGGGTMEAWLFLSSEAPAIEDVPTAPDFVIDAIDKLGKITFDILFEGLKPCTNYTVHSIATSADGTRKEKTTSLVDTDCPCDTGVGFGDPHYVSFDNNSIDFNGDCTYLLSEDCGNTPVTFQVFARHGTPSGTTRRRIVELILETYKDGQTHTLSCKHDGKCKVDKKSAKYLYFNVTDPQVLYKTGRNGFISFMWAPYSGVWIKYYHNAHRMYMGIREEAGLAGLTCGLFGNNNGKKEDDMIKKDGSPTTNITEFGESYAVNC